MGLKNSNPGCNCCMAFDVHVTRSGTGADVAGAAVTATRAGQPTQSGTTDSGGHCRLAPTIAGNWTVAATDGQTSASTVALAVANATVAVSLVLCECGATPGTLTMTSSDHVGNNGDFQDATLVLGPTPAGYAALAMEPNSYLSTASFTDQFGDSFRYYFFCSLGKYFLTRVYLTAIFGTPYEDTIRYTWVISASGNSCSTFAMTNGTVFIGGTAVNVTVS